MSSISNTIRDAAKDAKDAGREAGQAASAGARDIQADLVGLRDDVARLTHQIADIFAAKGTASWQRAKSDLDGVISDAGEKGREAIGAVREVGDNVVDAVDKSLKQRPYTALALAVGLGFLFGAIWMLSSVFRSAKSLLLELRFRPRDPVHLSILSACKRAIAPDIRRRATVAKGVDIERAPLDEDHVRAKITWSEQDVAGGKLVVEVTVKNTKARPKTEDQLRSDASALPVRFARAFADTIEN